MCLKKLHKLQDYYASKMKDAQRSAVYQTARSVSSAQVFAGSVYGRTLMWCGVVCVGLGFRLSGGGAVAVAVLASIVALAVSMWSLHHR